MPACVSFDVGRVHAACLSYLSFVLADEGSQLVKMALLAITLTHLACYFWRAKDLPGTQIPKRRR